jgi:hypothetical protein
MAAASKVAPEPQYGSKTASPFRILATLQRQKAAMGSRGVFVMHIRVAGAMIDVCSMFR